MASPQCSRSLPSIGSTALFAVLFLTPFHPGIQAQTTFTVNSTDDLDDGTCDAAHCSLREALSAADLASGESTIAFDIPGSAPHTIRPLSPLPFLTGSITVDGTTEPDFGGAPIIELDGTDAGDMTHGLNVAGTGNIIRALVINRFSGNGISIGAEARENRVEGCYLGTDVTGSTALGNGNSGVLIGQAENNIVGGTTVSARNLISGNPEGVTIVDVTATGNLVMGNYIGTNAAGDAAIPNGTGILLLAPDNTIGGVGEGAGNLISGNADVNLTIQGPDATRNTIQGNFIGTDATGSLALENGRAMVILDAPANIIGGTETGAGNVISGNFPGISVEGETATENHFQGNYIGVDATGTAPLGNRGAGIRFRTGASANRVGGSESGAGNVIANSGWVGVSVYPDAGTGNRILGNAIFDNSALGIELNRDGVSVNDEGDTDTGPNNLQNYPVITSAVANGGGVVQATLNSTPNSTFTLDFFSDTGCDATGFGEGRNPLGTASLTTDASGSGSVTRGFSGITGDLVTATATDAEGNTSEFSACATLSTLEVAPSPASRTVTPGQSATYTINVTDQGATFEGTVALECSGNPAGTTCTFDQDQITLAGGQASSTMTVTTMAPADSPPISPDGAPSGPWMCWLTGLLAGATILLTRTRVGSPGGHLPGHARRRTRSVWRISVAFLLVLAPLSCGDDGSNPPTGGTPPGSYAMTVTATWESVQLTTSVTMVVQE